MAEINQVCLQGKEALLSRYTTVAAAIPNAELYKNIDEWRDTIFQDVLAAFPFSSSEAECQEESLKKTQKWLLVLPGQTQSDKLKVKRLQDAVMKHKGWYWIKERPSLTERQIIELAARLAYSRLRNRQDIFTPDLVLDVLPQSHCKNEKKWEVLYLSYEEDKHSGRIAAVIHACSTLSAADSYSQKARNRENPARFTQRSYVWKDEKPLMAERIFCMPSYGVEDNFYYLRIPGKRAVPPKFFDISKQDFVDLHSAVTAKKVFNSYSRSRSFMLFEANEVINQQLEVEGVNITFEKWSMAESVGDSNAKDYLPVTREDLGQFFAQKVVDLLSSTPVVLTTYDPDVTEKDKYQELIQLIQDYLKNEYWKKLHLQAGIRAEKTWVKDPVEAPEFVCLKPEEISKDSLIIDILSVSKDELMQGQTDPYLKNPYPDRTQHITLNKLVKNPRKDKEGNPKLSICKPAVDRLIVECYESLSTNQIFENESHSDIMRSSEMLRESDPLDHFPATSQKYFSTNPYKFFTDFLTSGLLCSYIS